MIIPLGDDVKRTWVNFQFATAFMLAACIVVWGRQINLPPEAFEQAFYSFGLVPAVFFGLKPLSPELAIIPSFLTIFTSMFMHASWSHIFGNMLFLWVFGSSLEMACGHVRFVIFYLLCGVGAGLGQSLVDPSGTVPMIGASGAISGVMAAYMLVYPYNKVKLLIFIFKVRVPALALIGFWIFYQMYEMFSAAAAPVSQAGGVAWTAHVGGFATGMVLIFFLRRPGVKMMQEPALR